LRRVLVCSLIAVLLLATFAATVSAGDDQGDTYKRLLQKMDSSVVIVRKGGDPSETLSSAQGLYRQLVENENLSALGLAEENSRIENAFSSLISEGKSAPEDNIRDLRSDISQVAGELGIGLPFIYQNALFVILGLSIGLAFVITLVNKYTVNWEKVKAAKDRLKTWQKELRDAQRKRDMKRMHKLKQEQGKLMHEQKTIMIASFKPMIFYIIPYFLMWWWLRGLFGGWVVAWLPFHLPLPFFGTLVSMGFLSWYLIAYFGFAQLMRRFLIGV
jgi:uncharacterized membrane protein (DUF106 family)